MSREREIAVAVMQLASTRSTGLATYSRCYAELPNFIEFTAAERKLSPTRPGEPIWHQFVRNIRSHYETDGNFIERGLLRHVPRVGYLLTKKGRLWLENPHAG